MLHSTEEVVAVKGVIFKQKEYSETNHAVYIKILEKYRDDIGITDTIKLYGLPNEAPCYTNVISSYPLNDTIHTLFRDLDFPLTNPDSLIEQYFELKLHFCFQIVLREDKGLVRGKISAAHPFQFPEYPRFFEYPSSLFKDKLNDCSFDNQELATYNCETSDFLIYPNPVSQDYLIIKTVSKFHQFDRVSIYSINGYLKKEISYQGNFDVNLNKIDINDLLPGIYVIQIECGKKLITKKFVKL